MSINKYNINQEDICIWFKTLEGHSRIELMCSLIDICLPLELRFLGTYLEYAAGKHHPHLQKWEKDANNPISYPSTDLSDSTTRRRLCLFLTLLHSHNKSIATKLFDVLILYENLSSLIHISSTSKNELDQPEEAKKTETSSSSEYDLSSRNEFKLLLTLSSFHPAFSFNQRLIIREKFDQFIALTAGYPSLASDKVCVTDKSEVKLEGDQVSTDSTPQLVQPLIPDNNLLLIKDATSGNGLSITGGAPKQGLLPTPLLQIQELHYPHYHAIPVPSNFSGLPGQPILIPPSSLNVLNQAEQLLCVQSATNVPPNLNTNNLQYSPNISFHKVNTISNKNNSDVNVFSYTNIPPQQDISNTQFSSFHHEMKSNSKMVVVTDINERENTSNQPVLMQNQLPPIQVLNNNFHHHNGNSWTNAVMGEKSHNIMNTKFRRNTRGSMNDLRASLSDLDLSSHRSLSDTEACETTTVSLTNIHAAIASRPALSDANVIDPNVVHRNMNVGDYQMLYKSKLIGSPYTHVSDPNIHASIQSRPILLPKNITEINNIRNLHPNLTNPSQHIPPPNMHKMTRVNDNIPHSNLSDAITSVLSVSYANKQPIISSMTALQSPQVYISTDKQTLATGINGGYVQKPVNHDIYHGKTNVAISESQRLGINQNHLSADTHKISPISIQVHRKTSQTNTDNNHILSPGGCKFSSDYFESPMTSPAHSPRRSPYSSPSDSPVLHRKDHSNPKDRYDAYTNASNWLKSLRLHKYSDKFEGYTFQMMKDLSDEELSKLITTKGAQTKFKQNIEQLIKRGFKEFGSLENLFQNEDNVNSPTSRAVSPPKGSPINKLKTIDVTSMSSDVQSYLLSPVLNSHPHAYQTMPNFYNSDELHNHLAKGKAEEVNPQIQGSGLFEDMNGRLVSEPYVDDDLYEEVLTSRKPLATCYNCGAKGHYGHQCIEETMEAQTYSRYAFQLDFSRGDTFTNTEPKVGNASIISR